MYAVFILGRIERFSFLKEEGALMCTSPFLFCAGNILQCTDLPLRDRDAGAVLHPPELRPRRRH